MNRFKTSSSDVLACVESNQELAIHVVFTTERETVAALRQAAKLAAGLNARLLLVAPQLVPWAAEIDRPPVSPDFTAEKMMKLAEAAGVDAVVRVVLCRDRIVGLESVLGTNALVIAGESKLVSRLAKRGHQGIVERES